jgi:lysyl-tRNA synthetase class 2
MSDFLTQLRLRHLVKSATRDFFAGRGYLEVDTPVLTKCPGTEVYLRYFSTNWVDHHDVSRQAFLRSSPELHMKRVMSHGVSAAFQIGPCFRNHGERSDWHHPEFTMLEWYLKNLGYQQMIAETERYLRETAERSASLTNIPPAAILPDHFPNIGVFEAFREFAGINLQDQDPDLAAKAREAGVISVRPDDDFETSYFKVLIEKIEPRVMAMKGCVLSDYPPSQAALAIVENGVARRFEFYIGRVEICNGFFELTGEQNNRTRIGESLRERERAGNPPVPEDELFYRDMGRFNEPCSGNALGFDRWMSLLAGAPGLDPALPFRSDIDHWIPAP